jgi:hypothetical protein
VPVLFVGSPVWRGANAFRTRAAAVKRLGTTAEQEIVAASAKAPFAQGLSASLSKLRGHVVPFLLGQRQQPPEGDAKAAEHHAVAIAPISDEIIAEACRQLRVSDPLRRDFNGRTAHALVTKLDGSEAWLKISGIPSDAQDPCREAEIEADGLLGLPKPKVIAQSEWKQGDVSWRALLMAVAPSEAAARDPWSAPSPSDIPESWFADLREALRAVQRVRTSRFIYTPAEFTAAIKTYLPEGTPTKADAWCVQHGDLHWCNLTLPHLTLLDWEVWGLAPAGYGAGRLLAFSLLVPEVALKLEETFAEEFAKCSGYVGVLAAIAVVKRQIEAGDVPRELEGPIQGLIDRIHKGDFGKAPRLQGGAGAFQVAGQEILAPRCGGSADKRPRPDQPRREAPNVRDRSGVRAAGGALRKSGAGRE